jgi:hypothetical protein
MKENAERSVFVLRSAFHRSAFHISHAGCVAGGGGESNKTIDWRIVCVTPQAAGTMTINHAITISGLFAG